MGRWTPASAADAAAGTAPETTDMFGNASELIKLETAPLVDSQHICVDGLGCVLKREFSTGEDAVAGKAAAAAAAEVDEKQAA